MGSHGLGRNYRELACRIAVASAPRIGHMQGIAVENRIACPILGADAVFNQGLEIRVIFRAALPGVSSCDYLSRGGTQPIPDGLCGESGCEDYPSPVV